MFFSHTTGGLGIGHVTKRRAVAFVASAITDRPTHPPQDFSFVDCLNVMCNFVMLLVFHLSRSMFFVNFYELGINVRLPVMPTLPLLAGDLPFFASSPALPLWYINLLLM